MLPEAVHRPEPCGPRGRVATRCTSVHVTSTTQTPPACAPRTRSLAGRARGQLGPHGGAVLPVHTPAVGEPVDEEQPVAAAACAGPAPLHLAVAARIVHLDANRPVGDLGAHPDLVLRGHLSVAQGVRDELAEQQPDVLQRVHGDPRREPPRDLAARGRGRCGHRTKGHLDGVHLRSTTRAPTRRTRWRSASDLPVSSGGRMAQALAGACVVLAPRRSGVCSPARPGRQRGMPELPTQRDFEDYSAWTGRDVLTADGDRVGAIEVIFLDEATDAPEWVLVRVEDGDGSVVIPLAGASVEEQAIRVEPARDRIAAAPRIDVDETLSVADERRLYEHYGLAYSQEESSTVLPEGQAPSESGAEPAPPPTEERPRLRRYVGAPVPPPASGEAETATPPASPAASEEEPAGEAEATATPSPSPSDGPTTTGTGVTEPGPTPAPIPPPAPTPIPPEGGFQREAAGEEPWSGTLAALKRRPLIPVALAAAIAGLIAVLALRRRR